MIYQIVVFVVVWALQKGVLHLRGSHHKSWMQTSSSDWGYTVLYPGGCFVQQVVGFTSGWEDCGSSQCVFTLFQMNNMNTFSHFLKLIKFFKFFIQIIQ